MKLSLFSDYSLRVLIYASLREGQFQLKDVSKAYGISRNHLAQVVHRLGQLGYLETRRGRGGGCRLAQPASEVRLGKLFRQTEDQPLVMECFDPKTNSCRIAGHCRVQGALTQAMSAFYATLDQYTIADVAVGPQNEAIARILLAVTDG
jgi:Rrf2 family nitric oxide-sensitive transcriptional repressor